MYGLTRVGVGHFEGLGGLGWVPALYAYDATRWPMDLATIQHWANVFGAVGILKSNPNPGFGELHYFLYMRNGVVVSDTEIQLGMYYDSVVATQFTNWMADLNEYNGPVVPYSPDFDNAACGQSLYPGLIMVSGNIPYQVSYNPAGQTYGANSPTGNTSYVLPNTYPVVSTGMGPCANPFWTGAAFGPSSPYWGAAQSASGAQLGKGAPSPNMNAQYAGGQFPTYQNEVPVGSTLAQTTAYNQLQASLNPNPGFAVSSTGAILPTGVTTSTTSTTSTTGSSSTGTGTSDSNLFSGLTTPSISTPIGNVSPIEIGAVGIAGLLLLLLL